MNCWKCGKEISSYWLGRGSMCQECATLTTLEKMQNEQERIREKESEEREALLEALREEKHAKERLKEIRKLRRKYGSEDDHIDSLSREELPTVIFDSSEITAPEWWTKAKNPKNSVAAGLLAIFFGEWGFPFLYIGGSWSTLGVGMFFIFLAMLLLYPMASAIYLVITNLLIAVLFFSMDEDSFLKRFRYDQWKDKQIADLYGHQVNEMGGYSDIPPQKPSWNEAFPQKHLSDNSNMSNEKEKAFHSNSSNGPNTNWEATNEGDELPPPSLRRRIE